MNISAPQAEVLACIAEGMTARQISSALGISVPTVKGHTASARRRLRTKSSSQAALLWSMEARRARANAVLLARLGQVLGWTRAAA